MRGSSPRRSDGHCDERRRARSPRAGHDRRRRSRRNVARDAARTPRPSACASSSDMPDMRQLHDPGWPLDQPCSCRARHSSAGARRRDGSRAAAADPDARPHAARHRRRADVRALRSRRARSDLLGVAARPQPHPDRRRGARRRGHSLSHCRRRRGHPPSQPGVARRELGTTRRMSAASGDRGRWRRLGGSACAGERARSTRLGGSAQARLQGIDGCRPAPAALIRSTSTRCMSGRAAASC